MTKFACSVNEHTDLRLIESHHRDELFQVLDVNRDHLRRWHPWVDILSSSLACSHAIAAWRQQHFHNRGFYAGIWFRGKLCGVINHLNVDWSNRCTALGYWLDAAQQGQGIMTSCVRAMVVHGFKTWKLNRITIECATENTRSRAIPERLGFKLDGIIRSVEWLHDRYVDHAVYSLLQAEFPDFNSMEATPSFQKATGAGTSAQAWSTRPACRPQ